MTQSTAALRAVRLKADFMPITVLQVFDAHTQNIHHQLKTIVKQAPRYFSGASVIIDVQSLPDYKALNLHALCQLLKQYGMIPVGIRGLAEEGHTLAQDQGLAVLSKSASSLKTKPSPKAKVITKPVRAGMQIYAKETDLVILASVNAGAECIADGNIHVYGPLRGRALAGASGNEKAHIFCQRLDAELIAIAGCYLVRENIVLPSIKKTHYHIYLNANQLTVEGL